MPPNPGFPHDTDADIQPLNPRSSSPEGASVRNSFNSAPLQSTIDAFDIQPRPSTESANSAQSLLGEESPNYISSEALTSARLVDSIELLDWDRVLQRENTPYHSTDKRTASHRSTFPGVSYLRGFVAKARKRVPTTGTSSRGFNTAEQFRKQISRISSFRSTGNGRQLGLDPDQVSGLIDQRRGRPYISNVIRSSRYSIWSFFPRQLVAQFSKIANFYFLIVAILQIIPNLSTTGTWTTFIPLMVFVSISMAKEAFDDIRRYRLDNEENSRVISVMNTGPVSQSLARANVIGEPVPKLLWTSVKWKDVKVGEIIQVERDKPFPADIIVLRVHGSAGDVAHIETMALDGETNHKVRQPSASVMEVCKSLPRAIPSTRIQFTVEDPNCDLLQFNGFVTIGENKSPLTNDHVIYRGSILRNASSVLGLVIYTGEECKVRMNANKNPRIKAPSIQSLVNRVIVMVGLLVFTLAITCTLAYTLWFKRLERGFWYLRGASVALGPEFFSFFIMFNTMIPLSLYTSLEMVKLGQMYLLNDIDMYDEETDTPLGAHTSTINEELGQVKYIFSDKTGTLTKNKMELRKLDVAGEVYVHKTDPSGQTELPGPLKHVKDMVKATQLYSGISVDSPAHMLLLAIALCHTCIPERDKSDDKIDFQGISPDEIALLRAMRDAGYTMIDRQTNSLTMSISSFDSGNTTRSETYEILDVIEFSSKRKRMSVIVRLPNGQIGLFCKGADSVILKRLRNAFPVDTGTVKRGMGWTGMTESKLGDVRNEFIEQLSPKASRPSPQVDHEFHTTGAGLDNSDVLRRCIDNLNQFASEGLRTLMYGYRFLDEQTYTTWKRAYMEAQVSVEKRVEKIEAVSEVIERQMELIGATAIEDQLQTGVPESIESLQRAGIKIWMLTGDKRETAINVGRSCQLVSDLSTLIELNEVDFMPLIEIATADIFSGRITNPVLVVDGPTLSMIESETIRMEKFFELCRLADSVICCRASPMQKAFLVKMMRKHAHNGVTLAIGDGANDIAMIQEAHVGIGITGEEGLQAARMSDYSIGQFRFLVKLLLVHGRWNYIRTCKYILGTFWKEVVFYTTQALYQRWNGYTGTSLYEPWGLSMFNTLFSSLTVMSLGVFTKDLSESTLLKFPELYIMGQQNKGFNMKIYLGWTLTAFCDSVMIFYIAYFTYGRAESNPEQNDIFSFGLLTYTACVILVNAKLQLLEVYNKTILAGIIFLLPIGGLFLWNIILSFVYQSKSGQGIYHVPMNFLLQTGRNPSFWVALVLTVLSVILFELMISSIRTTLFPTDVDLFQQYEKESQIRRDGGKVSSVK